jgi:hypothetical protein
MLTNSSSRCSRFALCILRVCATTVGWSMLFLVILSWALASVRDGRDAKMAVARTERNQIR